ncbi:type II toxin-antitoxin system prevent-host-death family antitoxin [Candidatus Uhrbacteria bacterium]|nr:type II toxin-antitoxin system prevent-host-death family antitoxin [Candidatus Uhrbacteria bacterium]
MNNLVNLKELRENMAKYAKRVEKGDSFIIMKRSKPLFRISPVDEGDWETVVDFTKYKKGGMPAKDVMKALEELG